MMSSEFTIYTGQVIPGLRTLADASVHCCVTSPPYYNLRDYQIDGQIGLEKTPEDYIRHLVEVFREVKRVLRDDGTLWLNIGDSYAGSGKGPAGNLGKKHNAQEMTKAQSAIVPEGMKPKDLIGIPWMLAFALRADGWYLRSDIVWCLSGGSWIYAQTQNGHHLMMVRELLRLDPKTVKLWNGGKWTQLLGVSQSKRQGTELEIVLRSGERISCTPNHQFPTNRGLIEAGSLEIGDVIEHCQLPEPEQTRDCVLDEDAAWFVGLYIAEGSRHNDIIHLAGHIKETERWSRVQRIAKKFGGSSTLNTNGNKQTIRVHGKVLNALIDELMTGRVAQDKGFAPVVWRYSNRFIAAMVDGYLAGDGHWDVKNNRWRLNFCRNYNLERDLRTACARLGYTIVLNLATVRYDGRDVPTFHGELRKTRGGHYNERPMGQVKEIRKARCRYVYDLGVEDEPHTFALASGILTHNSKGSCMPESVKDRPTKSHEYVFLLTKQPAYYYDAQAIAEPAVTAAHHNKYHTKEAERTEHNKNADNLAGDNRGLRGALNVSNGTRNKRSVWSLNPQPFKGAHFAVMPEKLAEPCVLAGTSAHGCCETCGAPYERITENGAPNIAHQQACGSNANGTYTGTAQKAYEEAGVQDPSATKARILAGMVEKITIGWKPTCACVVNDPVPCTVLDPFTGSGTTGVVAVKHRRRFFGTELNPEYVHLAETRITHAILDRQATLFP